MSDDLTPMSAEELAAEGGTTLPDKEVMSLLDLNANLDLALDAAAPIDLAVGANANIAAPIEASVGANVLSAGSTAGAETAQVAGIHQGIVGDATATADQNSGIAQTAGSTPADTGTSGTSVATPGDALSGNLLDVNVNLNGDLNLAAPIDGAVAANANAAAPIDAAVSANVGSIDSNAVAVSEQQATIDQTITGDATATGDQTSSIQQ
ncbi:MAG TPA: hypothetical protein VFU36_04010 [Jatrophihabitans sp.]|nr:hypothetical protein [Jatrophihabitans sp.]